MFFEDLSPMISRRSATRYSEKKYQNYIKNPLQAWDFNFVYMKIKF